MEIARVIKVGYLSEEASRQLITAPWDDFPLNYEPAAITSVIDAAGGQPLLTQTICSGILERVGRRLVKEGPSPMTTATLAEVEAEILSTLTHSEYFRAAFSALPEDAQTLLATIAHRQKDKDAYIETASLNTHQNRKTLENLRRRDMVKEKDGEIRIAVDLMRQWLILNQRKIQK